MPNKLAPKIFSQSYDVPSAWRGPIVETAEKSSPRAVGPVALQAEPPTKVGVTILGEHAKGAAKRAEKSVKSDSQSVEESVEEAAKRTVCFC